MKMEFATLEELEDAGAKFLYYTDTGAIGELFKEKIIDHHVSTNPVKKEKLFKIFALTNTGKLYLSKNGTTTFLETEAKEFVSNDAKVKIRYMNKKGKYKWQLE